MPLTVSIGISRMASAACKVESAKLKRPPTQWRPFSSVSGLAPVVQVFTRFSGQSDGGNGTRGASPQFERTAARSAPSTFSSALLSAAALNP